MEVHAEPVRALPFDFGMAKRNVLLETKGYCAPNATSTGTTTVGIVFKDGVVLGADTRSTSGPVVADRDCEKIHHLAPNVYTCGAGTAADNDHVTLMFGSKFKLERIRSKKETKVVTVVQMLKQHLFKYGGNVGAYFMIGGVDSDGPRLCTMHADGSVHFNPFAADGSGCIAAISVIESGYKDNMTEEEAVDLAARAVAAGVFNDLGSGSNVDICVMKKDDTRMLRHHKLLTSRKYPLANFPLPKGITEIWSEKITPHKNPITKPDESEAPTMEAE
eukprot:TRINITY_DN3378_c0_g1_i1.p1 TRINITY_DN3378_c0_g1~~TRINITY_DN3378_c0_g1_i1.p1  ORF type:complete len:276 (-),score=62.60 TRINITY_DN3378_c0_g1_i1:12-839(-)